MLSGVQIHQRLGKAPRILVPAQRFGCHDFSYTSSAGGRESEAQQAVRCNRVLPYGLEGRSAMQPRIYC